jgi:predicted Holliday junction resolvase-like endonuclease
MNSVFSSTILTADNMLFLVLVCICCIIFLVLGILLGKVIQKHHDKSVIEASRLDAVKRSRAVLGGQFSEQLAPFLPDFPCNPGDVRFVGKPIDFVAFPGSAQGKAIEEILFIEVKSGDSQLSPREREIKRAVEKGSVRYVEYRIPQYDE